jgi:hypothetical protein
MKSAGKFAKCQQLGWFLTYFKYISRIQLILYFKKITKYALSSNKFNSLCAQEPRFSFKNDHGGMHKRIWNMSNQHLHRPLLPSNFHCKTGRSAPSALPRCTSRNGHNRPRAPAANPSPETWGFSCFYFLTNARTGLKNRKFNYSHSFFTSLFTTHAVIQLCIMDSDVLMAVNT